MKKTAVLLILLFSAIPVFADTPVAKPVAPVQATANTPPPLVQFSACCKSYAKPAEPVFYLVLSAISKNGYKVEEIQSKNGLILFKTYNKEFFANITQLDAQTALVKIIPADNNYSFQYSILDNLFQTVASELNSPIYKLN